MRRLRRDAVLLRPESRPVKQFSRQASFWRRFRMTAEVKARRHHTPDLHSVMGRAAAPLSLLASFAERTGARGAARHLLQIRIDPAGIDRAATAVEIDAAIARRAAGGAGIGADGTRARRARDRRHRKPPAGIGSLAVSPHRQKTSLDLIGTKEH